MGERFRVRLSALLLGLAALSLTPTPSPAATTLTVAYIPILPMAQLFVLADEGWAEKAGLDLKLTKFSSGPAMVQAMASGRYDVMYVGIGPALVARANGVPIKVVASNVIEQIALIGQGKLAEDAKGAATPGDAIRRFTAATGRKPRIATLPEGSVPDIVLRYWLTRLAGLPISSVDIVGMGEDRVQQALLARAVDAASILEPIVTIVRERMPDARIIVAGGDMFPDQPGAVVAVNDRALATARAAIVKLVALHIRATRLIQTDPARAARDAEAFIGAGLVPLPTLERAIRSPISHYVSDPSRIVSATWKMHDFASQIGTLTKPVSVDALFDLAIYREAARGR